ncbi:MAG: Mu-like prophage major head subunit gpT family protein [Acetobacter sp.]|uniref:Mu-like prophage major head subunit gpT family protein n=1 Tax=Acetobacter sp. TaxID=440 RepID=UPI0039ED23C6
MRATLPKPPEPDDIVVGTKAQPQPVEPPKTLPAEALAPRAEPARVPVPTVSTPREPEPEHTAAHTALSARLRRLMRAHSQLPANPSVMDLAVEGMARDAQDALNGSVKREDLEDDTYGYIFPWVEALGQDAATFPDKLVYETLSKGRASKCMDGQNFFDTDHEATNSTGKTVSYANMSTIAAGEAAQPWWYLFDTSKPLKAMIFQNRRPFTITPRTQLNSENVFMHREFQWGTDGRCTAGYGMYQFAFCSNRPLTGAVFQDAIARMASQCRRDGTPYGVQPTVMVVPRNLEGAARTLLKSTLVMSLADDGKTYGPASNVWADYCDLLVSDRLPQAVGA